MTNREKFELGLRSQVVWSRQAIMNLYDKTHAQDKYDSIVFENAVSEPTTDSEEMMEEFWGAESMASIKAKDFDDKSGDR